MSSVFPSGIDSFVNPQAGQPQSNPPHHQQHADANDAIHAVETKLGADASADPASVDYRLRLLETVAGSLAQVCGDVPAGPVDGTNAVFILSFAPSPPLSLMLFVNGVLMKGGGNDFTLLGSRVTLALAPPAGTPLVAFYLTSSSNAVSGETPAGAVDGSNSSYALSRTPNPAQSLMLFLNGILQSPGGNDFTLTGSSVAFAQPPPPGSALVAHYRA